MRKGYASEYKSKKELVDTYGKDNCIKVAISQVGSDYLVICCGELIKTVEVKECHDKKYYPSAKDKDQFRRIVDFAKSQGCIAELWVYTIFKRNCELKKFVLYSPQEGWTNGAMCEVEK